jgi:hypothetical protein
LAPSPNSSATRSPPHAGRAQTAEIQLASIASRFLIELATTVPPAGAQMVSFEIYGRMLALAAAITRLGLLSDVDRHGLASVQVILMPGPELVPISPAYLSAQFSYATLVAEGDIARSRERYLQRGQRPPDEASLDALIADVDEAHRAETGCTITELLAVVAELLDTPERPQGYATIDEGEALRRSVAAVGEPAARCALAALTLEPRADFLSPEAPFGTEDIYPWRFNRRLSYLRRPLLRSGEHRLLFGLGALYSAY